MSEYDKQKDIEAEGQRAALFQQQSGASERLRVMNTTCSAGYSDGAVFFNRPPTADEWVGFRAYVLGFRG